MQTEQKFDMWCLVELFGHQKLSGKVSERNLGGAAFLQVDVPETTNNPAFTKILNPSAIYAINPIDEQTAKAYAENIESKPINTWDVHEFLRKANKQLAAKSDDAEIKYNADDEEHES